MKVYISGAITNNPNFKEQFEAAEELLRNAGHKVINPAKNQGYTYKEYIDIGLFELMHCEAIYMLNGWEKSTGAKLEHEYAKAVGFAIWYQMNSKKPEPKKTETELNELARFLEIAIKMESAVRLEIKRVKQIRELVKKEQPRAVITDYGFTLCPHCGSDVDEYDEYCRQCGQHLL